MKLLFILCTFLLCFSSFVVLSEELAETPAEELSEGLAEVSSEEHSEELAEEHSEEFAEEEHSEEFAEEEHSDAEFEEEFSDEPEENVEEPSFTEEDCAGWAELGECESNDWMWENCEGACQAAEERHQQHLDSISDIESFYDLKANDIDGNEVDFQEFKGKIVVITNVASFCGRTEQHYNELVQLHRDLKATTSDVEILAFPCNQFGRQEPEECPIIKRFAQEKGVEFRMMYKVDVNGDDTGVVYKYLKSVTGPRVIQWNFDTYYVVDREGGVHSFTGATPLQLFDPLTQLIDDGEL